MTDQPAEPTSARYYINSWSARTGQRFGARIIDSSIAFGCVVLVVVIGPHGRPVAQDLLIVGLVAAIESATLTRTGRTLGMHVFDLRVAALGRSTHPDWLAAWRRSVPIALCYPVLVPGIALVVVMPIALVASISLSPLRRGFHDRLSETVVVQADAPAVITEATMDTWWQPGRAVVLSPWGRVPDLYDRRRARAHRLDGAWWLAAIIMVATIASVGIRDVPLLWVWLTIAWMVAVSVDETWWLMHRGATPGHARFGYRVVDLTTGEPPSRGRALARSVLLAPLLYVPPLQVILALWVHGSSLHRGPHDLVAHTIVVQPDYRPASFIAPAAPVRLWTSAAPVMAPYGISQPPRLTYPLPPLPPPPPPIQPGPF